MAITFAFDVYGTLVDPQAIARQLEAHLGAGFEKGAAVPFDPWELELTRVIENLAELGDLVLSGDPAD